MAALRRGLSGFAGATAVALLLVGIVSLAVAMNGGGTEPLLLLYPGIAAFGARRVHPGWLVVVAATLAPPLALAVHLFTYPLSLGRGTLAEAQATSFPPNAFFVAGVAVATAAAIGVSATFMRRAGLGWQIAGFAAGFLTWGVAYFVAAIAQGVLWPPTT